MLTDQYFVHGGITVTLFTLLLSWFKLVRFKLVIRIKPVYTILYMCQKPSLHVPMWFVFTCSERGLCLHVVNVVCVYM